MEVAAIRPQGLTCDSAGAWSIACALRRPNDAQQPWRHRSWIFPRDAQFAEKAGRILDLYAKTWDGTPLQSDEFVISADEKPSLQARRRKHPTLAPGPARPMRVEHEYFRTGALTYLAAWDVHRAKLFGRCEPKTTIGAVDRLVEQVMTMEPYRSARRVFGSPTTAPRTAGRRRSPASGVDGLR